MKKIYFKYTNKELLELMEKDKILKKYIIKYGKLKKESDKDIFNGIVRAIIGQQISTKAQTTIMNRVYTLVKEITPENILKLNLEELKSIGISYKKANNILNIANKIQTNEFNIQKLKKLSDDDVIKELVKLKGIGKWTAEMLLIFSLGRKNILSYDDLAIRRGLMNMYNLTKITKEDVKNFKKIYSPLSSIASIYIWQASSDTDHLFDTKSKIVKNEKSIKKTLISNSTETKKLKEKNINVQIDKLSYAVYKTKIGYMKLGYLDNKVYILNILENYNEKKHTNLHIKNKFTDKVFKELDEYLRGKRKKFSFEYIINNKTDFITKVLTEVKKIPYGKTKTYKEIARNIGNEKAYRAVGNALNKNDLVILIPCHRILSINNKNGGYKYGKKIKEILLNIENKK